MLLPDGGLAADARPIGVTLETRAWRVRDLESARVGGLAVIVATTFLDEKGAVVLRGGTEWGDTPAEALILGDAGKTLLWRGLIGPMGRETGANVRLEAAGVLLLYETRRDLTRCDGTFLRLHPQRFDPAAKRFRPASVAPDTMLTTPLRARPLAAAEALIPAQSFRAAAATTTAEDEGNNIEDLGPPLELDDGNLATIWMKTRGGWGRGETFVYRAPTARWNVRGLRFVPAGPEHNRVTRFVLGVDDKRYLVELPGKGPQWIELPAPIATSCVEVALDAVAEVRGGRTAIAELAVLTERDAKPAAAATELADQVAAGGDTAAEAERLIGVGGEPMLAALRAGADQREPAARRRVARALARLGDAKSALEIAWAIREAEPEEAERLFQALASFGQQAQKALYALLSDDAVRPPVRARAATLLGRLPGAFGLLEPLLGEGPRELRAAVLSAASSQTETGLALAATTSSTLGHAADAWLVWARIARREAPAAEPALLAALDQPSHPYPLRYRLAQAAAVLANLPEVRAALGRALAREREPAIKEAALALLDPAGRELAAGLAADPDPGVRAAAVRALGEEAAAVRATGDRWPVVRRAALGRLGASCVGRDAIHRVAGADPDEPTRRTALGLMVQCKDPRAGRTLLAVVRDARLSPPLRAFAAALAADAGDPGLVDALADELDTLRGDIPYTESEGQVRVAVAIAQALGRLRNPRALEAIAKAAADPAVPPIQAAALTALGELCPVGARQLLGQFTNADDALVARSARGALRRCHR